MTTTQPPTPLPHMNDSGDHGPGIIVGNITVAVLASVAVGLRIVSRRMQRLSLEADDYLIFAALVSTAIMVFRVSKNTTHISKPFGWAMVTCTLIGQCGSCPQFKFRANKIRAVKHGLGTHIGTVPKEQLLTEGQVR